MVRGFGIINQFTMNQLDLVPNKYDFTLFPIVNGDVWAMYKKAVASFWTVEEVDLSDDLKDWMSMSDEERHLIKHILCFFASADTIVNINLAENFINEVDINEVKCFYGFQIAIENIHSEMYSLLIDTLIMDVGEKEECFMAVKERNSVVRKTKWALKWCDGGSFEERLFAFAIVEGIFFSSSFCAIFWLKHRGLMPGLCFSNELISRDEGLHCDFAALLYKNLWTPLSEEKARAIMDDAIMNELLFVQESFVDNLFGLNAKLMGEYVKFCADRLMIAMGHEAMYKAKNPFPWMQKISIDGKTNFFEKRVSEYSRVNHTFEFDINTEF